ncbi:MAG: DctP family TRAP transporter solute-binding subunit [Candidatus Latescibacteria bacterium]|nr:DctP family TRAP transporter solute-binding subunit [Candidatus Latescibacterota bacterium]
MNLIKITALLAIASIVLSCSGQSEGPQELKVSLILGENSDWYRGVARFKQLIEERTSGRYRIKIFPHAQLAGGVQRTELEMVQSGVIDMSMESSILLSLIEPQMSVLSLPWLFDDYDEADRILEGSLGHELLDMLPRKELVGLAYGVNGFRQITNSRNALCTPDDIKGMKIRVPAIKMYIDIFKLLGADPSSMNFGELPIALAQGTMDGQENPLSVIYSAGLFEVQKHLTIWNYSYDPVILCINRRLWESFTTMTREIFIECAREAMRYERDLVALGETALTDSLEARGMDITTLPLESLDEFRRLVEPVYKDYADEMGGDLTERFRDAVK